MAAANTNRVVLSGNLTRDPELRTTASGTSVCSLRVASNQRAKINGEWADKVGYFDLTVFGSQGENATTYLRKGRSVIADGKLAWREWETQDGQKRQAVEIIVDNLEWGRQENSEGSQASDQGQSVEQTKRDDDIAF